MSQSWTSVLQFLNIDKNKIKTLNGLGQMTQIKDLYLGENEFK